MEGKKRKKAATSTSLYKPQVSVTTRPKHGDSRENSFGRVVGGAFNLLE
jgi:hypothetical protein